MSALLSRLLRFIGVPLTPRTRRWVVVAAIDALGTGMVLPIVVLYFTGIVGLSAEQVGLGMSVTALLAVGITPFTGAVVDRFGPRRTLVVCWSAGAVGYGCFLLAGNWWLFVAVYALTQLGDNAARAAKPVFIARLVKGQERVRLMAFQRSVRNMGYGVGGALASLALLLGGRHGYPVVILGDAASFVVAAVLVAGIVQRRAPAAPGDRAATGGHSASGDRAESDEQPESGKERPAGSYRVVLRNRPYLGLSLLNVVVMLHTSALTVALPLWLSRHTHAPTSLVGTLFTLNTAVVVLLQVRATRRVNQPADTVPVYRWAAVAFAVAAAAYVLAAHVGVALAIVLLVAAVLFHTWTEMSVGAASWVTSVNLADERYAGRYLAVYSLGNSLQYALGPSLITLLMAGTGDGFWLVLALALGAGCLASAAIVRRHPHAPVTATPATTSAD